MPARIDGRQANQLRPVTLQVGFIEYPEGSVLIQMGKTKVLCNATISQGVPQWITAQGKEMGWVTAEYAMLPRSTIERTPRETRGLRGRTQEIRRFIGRGLRAALNLDAFVGHTCVVDCDVLQADGGTRTAALTGGYVALELAMREAVDSGTLSRIPLTGPIAAVSVGVVEGEPLLDLCYAEDAQAEVDANIIMNSEREFIELQGTAEKGSFSRDMLEELLDLAETGISQLFEHQWSALDH